MLVTNCWFSFPQRLFKIFYSSLKAKPYLSLKSKERINVLIFFDYGFYYYYFFIIYKFSLSLYIYCKVRQSREILQKPQVFDWRTKINLKLEAWLIWYKRHENPFSGILIQKGFKQSDWRFQVYSFLSDSAFTQLFFEQISGWVCKYKFNTLR